MSGEVARAHGVSEGRVSKPIARYREEGEAAFEPRSRRPTTSPTATPASTVELIVRILKELADQGMDAGADTVQWHLEHHPRHQGCPGDPKGLGVESLPVGGHAGELHLADPQSWSRDAFKPREQRTRAPCSHGQRRGIGANLPPSRH